jgi:hypothetical protein
VLPYIPFLTPILCWVYHMVPYGAGLVPYGAVWWKSVPAGAIWCHMVEVGAVWCHMVEVGAIWCHMVECGVFEMWVTIPSSLKCADCNSLKCAGL